MDYRRNTIRLKSYDYSSNGMYFVTFCTHNRQTLLSNIQNESAEKIQSEMLTLKPVGQICDEVAYSLLQRYPCIRLHAKVIMPNHVHALIEIQQNTNHKKALQLSDYVGSWKRETTYKAHKAGFRGKLWQRSFHEHIVRSEKDFLQIIEYIENNPKKWLLDRFYRDS